MTSTCTPFGIWKFLGEEKNREFRENSQGKNEFLQQTQPTYGVVSDVPSLLYVVRIGQVKKGAAFIFFLEKESHNLLMQEALDQVEMKV